MIIRTLASGSKGNSSYVEVGTTRFLIDVGISYRHLVTNLEKINVNIDDIDYLLITHAHSDHVSGLRTLIKHSGFKIYIKEEMYQELKDILPKDRIELYQEVMHLKDSKIEVFNTSHDTSSVGFIINHLDKSLVYVTDTGYLNTKNLRKMVNKSIYYIESNHDEEMLMDGPYPYYLKQRIISDRGHLSNKTTAGYLEKLIGNKTKYVILAHLSEKNNTKEKALEETMAILEKIKYQPEVLIAEQNEIGSEVGV